MPGPARPSPTGSRRLGWTSAPLRHLYNYLRRYGETYHHYNHFMIVLKDGGSWILLWPKHLIILSNKARSLMQKPCCSEKGAREVQLDFEGAATDLDYTGPCLGRPRISSAAMATTTTCGPGDRLLSLVRGTCPTQGERQRKKPMHY